MTVKHGLHKAPEYNVWSAMIQRCTNPNSQKFGVYGARGIRVCDRWLSFELFIADMGRRPSDSHSIDRIDNDGDYMPGNCRWATDGQQRRNRSDNVYLTHEGRSMIVSDWAEKSGLANSPFGSVCDSDGKFQTCLILAVATINPKLVTELRVNGAWLRPAPQHT